MRRGFFVSFISAVVVARACGAHVVQPSRVRFRSTLGRTVVRALQDADARAKVEREIYLHPEDTPYRMASRPSSAWGLAIANFRRQGDTIIEQAASTAGALIGRDDGSSSRMPAVLGLYLSNAEVAAAETRREAAGSGIAAHPFARMLYDVGCLFLDHFFDGRPIARFWFLETVARVPYFSYTSLLHLYESLGWWRATGLRQVHHAEEWNELHHLLIMEALGGDAVWSDRFIGYHAALVYYWLLVVTYLISPAVAYEFMELLEAHAVDTYSTFVKLNRHKLAALPAPEIARSYYTKGDLYLFDGFQQRPPGSRRPPCNSLLDTFVNICADESEHVKTMRACQEYCKLGTVVTSPHEVPSATAADAAARPQLLPDGVSAADIEEAHRRREAWKQWAQLVNDEMADQAAAAAAQV